MRQVKKEKCIGCNACMTACPVNAIRTENGKAKISTDCIDCGKCQEVCPVDAIEG